VGSINSGFKELEKKLDWNPIPQFKANALRDPRCQASEQEIVQSVQQREEYFSSL
jgi:hypothetical protein